MKTDSRSALVIGGTRGIGRATARLLARTGRTVLVSGRDRRAGAETVAEIGDRAQFMPADVSRPSSVARLAEEVREQAPGLDIVIHSADVLLSSRVDTPDGIELAFATNFLSRVQLNAALLDLLKANAPARIVHVAAAGMPGRLDLTQVPPTPGKSAAGAHNIGQRANDVYGIEFASRLAGTGVDVAILSPGMVDTGIRLRHVTGPLRVGMRTMEMTLRPWTTTPEQFAERVVAIATETDLAGGPLFGSTMKPKRPSAKAADPALRAALWERSHALVGAAPEVAL